MGTPNKSLGIAYFWRDCRYQYKSRVMEMGGESGKKRDRQNSLKIYKRMKRDRDEYLKDPLSTRLIWKRPTFKSAIFKIKGKVFYDLFAKILTAPALLMNSSVEKCTRELADLVTMYPELCDRITPNHIGVLFWLLGDERLPNIQSPAAIILQSLFANSSSYRNRVIELITFTPEKLLKPMSSIHDSVIVQALELLHSITLSNPACPTFKEFIIHRALQLVCSLLYSKPDRVVYSASKALTAICLVYPDLPFNKLEMVVGRLVGLLEHDSFKIRLNACSGIQYLCDGRNKMVVDSAYFDTLCEALESLIWFWKGDNFLWTGDNSHEIPVAALAALGSIVRCSDEFIKFMIEYDHLWMIKGGLQKVQLYFVKSACWISSNITAGITNQIKDVVYTEVISPLLGVVENYEYIEAKEEALWALLNAIHGVGSDNERLKNLCVKPLWRTLKACHPHEQIVYLCLEALIKLEGVEITCNDQPLGGAEFIEFLCELYMGVPAECIGCLAKQKKQCFDSCLQSNERGYGKVQFCLTCTCEEELPLFLWCDISGGDLAYSWLDCC